VAENKKQSGLVSLLTKWIQGDPETVDPNFERDRKELEAAPFELDERYEVRHFDKGWRSKILSVCGSRAEAEEAELAWSKVYPGQNVKIVPKKKKA